MTREQRLERCLNFFASVIKSGEPWTETCEIEYRAALSSASPPTPEVGSEGEVFEAECLRCGRPFALEIPSHECSARPPSSPDPARCEDCKGSGWTSTTWPADPCPKCDKGREIKAAVKRIAAAPGFQKMADAAPAPSPDPARCHECALGKTERSPFHVPTCARWCAPSPDPGERPCGVQNAGNPPATCDLTAGHAGDHRWWGPPTSWKAPAPSPAAAPPPKHCTEAVGFHDAEAFDPPAAAPPPGDGERWWTLARTKAGTVWNTPEGSTIGQIWRTREGAEFYRTEKCTPDLWRTVEVVLAPAPQPEKKEGTTP